MINIYTEQLKKWTKQFTDVSMHNVALMTHMVHEYSRYNELVLDSVEQTVTNGNHIEKYMFEGQSYSMEVHLPPNYDSTKKYPCLVAIHGCMQNAEKLAESSRINQMADQCGYIVVYPEQELSKNPINCWNWMAPENQIKYSGEPYRIITGIEHALSKYSIDRDMINATGISSGGAICMTLACLYPEYFNALAIHAGLKHNAADNILDSFKSMYTGITNKDTKSDLQASKATKPLSTIVFHGTKDETVNIKNAELILHQMDRLNNSISGIKTPFDKEVKSVSHIKAVDDKYAYSITNYAQPGGAELRFYKIDGMNHAWSGGSETLYSDPKGPDATKIMFSFFNEAYINRHPDIDPDLLEKHINKYSSYKHKEPVISGELAFGT